MKKILSQLLVLCALPFFCFAQDNFSNEFSYDVNVVDPPLSISKAEVRSANTLLDINKYYKPDWVKAYESVEILATQEGKIHKALSKSNMLTAEQKTLLENADDNTTISVNIVYLPENNLKQNDLKKANFSFKVAPEKEATFNGGTVALKQYLKDNAINNISADNFKQYALTAVKFTVDEEGQITNTHIFESSRDEKTDALLIAAIANMPNWQSAEYASGLKVKQDFVFTVGDMRSCVVNLLNIRETK